MRASFNPLDTNALRNASRNIDRVRAALIVQQQNELKNQQAILTQTESDYNAAQKELLGLEESTDAYNEKARYIEDVALVMSLIKETIAQYQMNLLDFNVQA